MPNVELPQAELKIVLLGDTNTGKTSLVLRFITGTYKSDGRSAPTVGAFFLTKRLTVEHGASAEGPRLAPTACKLLLWDTAGQVQFQKLAQTYYANAAAAILTYDVTQPTSLVRLRHWLDELHRYTAQANHPALLVCLCACKCDLPAAPGLTDEARRLAASISALYMETSAKENTQVHALFHTVALQCLRPVLTEQHLPNTPTPLRVTSPLHSPIVKPEPCVPPLRTATPDAESDDATGPHSTATTAAHNTSDDGIVDPSVTQKDVTSSSSSSPMCEGSLLVCGTDDKTCRIM